MPLFLSNDTKIPSQYTNESTRGTSKKIEGAPHPLLAHPILFIWPPSGLCTRLDKSVYFLSGETVHGSYIKIWSFYGKKWHTQWGVLYTLPIHSYWHTALKGLINLLGCNLETVLNCGLHWDHNGAFIIYDQGVEELIRKADVKLRP